MTPAVTLRRYVAHLNSRSGGITDLATVAQAIDAGIEAMLPDKALAENVHVLRSHKNRLLSKSAAVQAPYELRSALWAAILKLESAL